MRRRCCDRTFNYATFIFTYKLAIKLSQTYLLDSISVFCQSVKAEHNQKSIQTIERQKHLLPVFLPHFLHIYSNQYWKIKPSMLILPAKICQIFTLFPDKLLCHHSGSARPFAFHGIFLFLTVTAEEGAFPWLRSRCEERAWVYW